MKKLVTASVFATVLAASTAFAFEVPTSQPIKPIEGPNTRYAAFQPIQGIEGPDLRLTADRHSTQPVEGPERPRGPTRWWMR